MTKPVASLLLLLDPIDNCLVACSNLAAGTPVQIDGITIALPQPVPLGYKVARFDLAVGKAVFRYAAHIGSTTQRVAMGELLHTHNLQSDYLPTYTLVDGKRFVEQQLH